MPRFRACPRLLVLLAVATGSLAACGHDSTYHGPSAPGGLIAGAASTIDLGEIVFTVARDRLAASPGVAPAQIAALDARRSDLVAAINAIADAQTTANLGPTLAGVLRLVDDGTLPDMASNLAALLDGLVKEPGQPTLGALVSLGGIRTVLQTRDALDLVGGTLRLPAIERAMIALADVIEQNDGRDAQGQPNQEPDLIGELLRLAEQAARGLALPPATPASGASLATDLAAELLVAAPPRAGVTFGAPAWVVEADLHGNPAVAVDPQRSALYAPFLDADADGAADTDASGAPIDAQGAPIDVPPFGEPYTAGRDADGLALAHDGNLLYRYVDAKTTLLSHLAQMLGEALRRGTHLELVDVGEIVLGARVPNDAGTPGDPADDYLALDADGPLPDLAWGLLETWKPAHVPAVQRAIADVIRKDPDLAERVVVAAGRVIEAARPLLLAAGNAPPTAKDRQRTDRLLRLADRVFQAQSAATGRPMAIVLVETLVQLGAQSRAVPKQLAMLMRYRTLVLDANGQPTTGSVRVDRTLPARTPTLDNRSALERLLTLLANADQCPTFVIAGRPLSETILELMAGRSVGTVSSLIGLTGNSVVRALVSATCPGIGPELDSLEALRQSGALGAALPITKVFVDQGETRLLVDLLVTLQRDYDTALRPIEEQTADLLDTPGFDQIFDLVDLLVQGQNGNPVRDPLTGARAIDAFVQGLAVLCHHPSAGVPDRHGARQPSQAHLLLTPLRALEDRLVASPGGLDLARALLVSLSDLVVDRVVDQNGTPNDPSDDREVLQNPALVPFLGQVLDKLNAHLPADATARRQELAALQADLRGALRSRAAATLWDLALTLRNTQSADGLRLAVMDLLTPDPTATTDAFSGLLKMLVTGLQADVDLSRLRPLASFLADQLTPGRREIPALVRGAGRVLAADGGRVVLTGLRNAFDRTLAAPGLPTGEAPVEVLLSVVMDVRSAGSAASATTPADQVRDLASLLESAVDFLRDDPEGLSRIFALIRGR